MGLATVAAVVTGFLMWPYGDGQQTGGPGPASPSASATDSPAVVAASRQEREAAFGNGDLRRFADGVVAAASRCEPREEVARGQAPYAETGMAVPDGTDDVVRCEGPGWIAYLWDGASALEALREQRNARSQGNGDFPDGLRASGFVEWFASGPRKAIYFEPVGEFEGEFAADLIATGDQDQEAFRAVFVELMG